MIVVDFCGIKIISVDESRINVIENFIEYIDSVQKLW